MASAGTGSYTRNPDGSVVLATTGKLASTPSRGSGTDTKLPMARPISKMSGVKVIAQKGQGTSGKSAY